MTEHQHDTDAWAPWQMAYRFGVFLILPPDSPRVEVNSLRARLDPKSHAYCEAHISLTVPLPRALKDEDWHELRSIASRTEPIAIRYGPLMNYLPHPGVCLEIAPQIALDRLRVAIERARVFADAEPRNYPFSAHMTIAEFITADETTALMERLADAVPVGQFTCERLSYMVPDEAFRFMEVDSLRLGGAHGRPAAIGSVVG